MLWTYSLSFREETPAGVSPAWKCTDVSGNGFGFFYAHRLIEGAGNYQYNVKQGLATLDGTKTHTDSLSEENSHTIGFHITPAGSIGFDLVGSGQQAHWKYFDYDGTTGETSYGGGNGTISLDETGFVHSWQSRELDWEYDGSDYQGEAQKDKLTGGFHKHVYLNEYSYTGCGYSSESSANWSETSDWENELPKHHSFSDTTWPILWTGPFTSYEQSGCGCGLWGFETWVPIGAQQDTTSTSTIGRLPSGGLIAPAPLSAAWAFHGYLRSARDVSESPHQVRAAGLSSFRAPNAIHGDGSPSLPQNEIFAAWGQWRERGRLNQDLEDAIDALANLIAPPASGTRPARGQDSFVRQNSFVRSTLRAVPEKVVRQETPDFCSPLAGSLSLQCGGLTPLWLCLSFSPLLPTAIVQNTKLTQNESGVKPPPSKTARFSCPEDLRGTKSGSNQSALKSTN